MSDFHLFNSPNQHYPELMVIAEQAWPSSELAEFDSAALTVQLLIPSSTTATIIVDQRFATPVIVNASLSVVLNTLMHGFKSHICANYIINRLWGHEKEQLTPIAMPGFVFLPTSSFNRKLPCWFNVQTISQIKQKTAVTTELTLTCTLLNNVSITTTVNIGRKALSFKDRLRDALNLQQNARANYNRQARLNGGTALPVMPLPAVVQDYAYEQRLFESHPLITSEVIHAKEFELVFAYLHDRVEMFFDESDESDASLLSVKLFFDDLLYEHPKSWRKNVLLHANQFQEKISKYVYPKE